MSDEQQDLNLEDVGAGAEDVSAPRRGGLLSGMLLNILKWVAIGIGVIIIVVTTTVLTFRVLNKGNTQNLAAVSPEYAAQAKPLASYDNIEQIRGQTADETPAVFLLQVSLGYDPADKEVSVEIGERAREIQDLVLKDISQKRAADLSTTHYDELQAELMTQINTIMRTGKVKKVMFRQFVVQK
ncbi:MAG: flagellar basal body-associated FliL family protein [Spirochaetia bacterium]|jgi:flagellar FliL protein